MHEPDPNLWFSRLVSQIMDRMLLCWGATTFIASPLSLSFHNLCITGHDGRSHTVYYFQAILSLGIGTLSFHKLCITGHQLWWAEFHFAPFPSIYLAILLDEAEIFFSSSAKSNLNCYNICKMIICISSIALWIFIYMFWQSMNAAMPQEKEPQQTNLPTIEQL